MDHFILTESIVSRRGRGRKELTNLGTCIVLSYFSVGTRIVWHCIIAFMANKRKDVPVRPGRWSFSATTVPSIPRPFHPGTAPRPSNPSSTTASACYCHRVVRSVIEGVAIGFVFARNIVRGLPDPVNRSATLRDTETQRIISRRLSESLENVKIFLEKSWRSLSIGECIFVRYMLCSYN